MVRTPCWTHSASSKLISTIELSRRSSSSPCAGAFRLVPRAASAATTRAATSALRPLWDTPIARARSFSSAPGSAIKSWNAAAAFALTASSSDVPRMASSSSASPNILLPAVTVPALVRCLLGGLLPSIPAPAKASLSLPLPPLPLVPLLCLLPGRVLSSTRSCRSESTSTSGGFHSRNSFSPLGEPSCVIHTIALSSSPVSSAAWREGSDMVAEQSTNRGRPACTLSTMRRMRRIINATWHPNTPEYACASSTTTNWRLDRSRACAR